MRQKLLRYFIVLALSVLSIGVAVFLYWNFEPNDVLTIKGPIAVKPVVAKGEGAVTLHFNICKNIDVKGRVSRSFVSNKTELLSPPAEDSLGKFCNKDLQAIILIPPQTPPDRYRVKYSITYKINPITEVTETFQSEQFDVVSNDTVLPNPLPDTLPNSPNFYNQTSPILTPSTNGQSQTNNSSESKDARPNAIQGQNQSSAQQASGAGNSAPAPTDTTQRPGLFRQLLNLIGL